MEESSPSTRARAALRSALEPDRITVALDPRLIPTVCAVALVIALLAGVGLRTIALDRVPPGLNQDEACNGYDAFSLLTTGRDQHGNPLPIAIQAFNDYRMPLFDYSLVPVVATLGLKPAVVRLGAALWGSADLILLAIIAWLIAGIRASAIAVIVAAISPWHLPLSRFGHEAITASATVSAAMACFFAFARSRDGDWLILAALAAVLSLYSYSIVKVFLPLTLAFVAILYRRELLRSARQALLAVAIVTLGSLPQLLLLWFHGRAVQARFNQVSIFARSGSAFGLLRAFAQGWAGHFSPDFLFNQGQQFLIVHPPGFGQLLFGQAILIAAALAALREPRYRKAITALLGWLMIAAVPAALTVPTPHALRDILAFAPWTLLSAVGFVYLLDLPIATLGLRLAAASLILIAVLAEGTQVVSFYFREYPALAAPAFQYGMDRVVVAVNRLGQDREPVVISSEINQPYIYVLFYDRYPPTRFQREQLDADSTIFAPIESFDRFRFADPMRAFFELPRGIFVFTSRQRAPAPPALEIRDPDGTVAYRVVAK